MFDEGALTKKLIELSEDAFAKSRKNGPNFNVSPEASKLLTDLEKYPHLFLLACISNRRIPAEKAWNVPYNLSQFTKKLDINSLSKFESTDWLKFTKSIGHRLPATMAKSFELAIKKIQTDYDGNAADIWNDKPSSAVIIKRLREFNGVGQKIAAMTAQILKRGFGIEYADRTNLDLAIDVHTKRVMKRLGLVTETATKKEILSKAREMNPDFPGIFDLPLWNIGRDFCHETKPKCKKCQLKKLCTFAKA